GPIDHASLDRYGCCNLVSDIRLCPPAQDCPRAPFSVQKIDAIHPLESRSHRSAVDGSELRTVGGGAQRLAVVRIGSSAHSLRSHSSCCCSGRRVLFPSKPEDASLLIREELHAIYSRFADVAVKFCAHHSFRASPLVNI